MDVRTLTQVAAQNLPPDPSGGDAQGGAPAVLSFVPLTVSQPDPSDPTATSAPDSASAGTAFHLPAEVAKVFTGGSASHVSITFQVEHNPNEIVTVFKNTLTGEVITQVPSEIMIKMAEFFDQVAGVVLDKSA